VSPFARSVSRIASVALFGRVPLVAVVGAPRSGSTLLIRILDSHSRIAAPCEIGVPGVFPREDEKYPVAVKKWGQICAYYGVDPGRSERDPYVLFRSILKREKKQVLVLKDPRASLYIRNLERYRPRYVHLIRDARSVASSRMFADPGQGFERWLDYHRSVMTFLSPRPERVAARLRYEDLIANPERQLQSLLAALGLDYEVSMLRFGDFPHADDRLRLWGDRSAADSALQGDLGGSIRVEKDPPTWREAVLALYERLPEVKELNETFGYG
jgi:hypothetical protein